MIMKWLLGPNPAIHVKIGRFWVPVTGVIGVDVLFVEGEGHLFRLGRSDLHSVLMELLEDRGIEVEWDILSGAPVTIDGDRLIIYEDSPRPLSERPRTIVPVDEFLDVIWKHLRCPHRSDRHRLFLKKCKDCVFFWDGRCRYNHPSFRPVREILEHGIENYMYVDVFQDYDYGVGEAGITFVLEDVKDHQLEKLKLELRWEHAFDFSTSEFEGHEFWIFTKRYALKPEYGDTPHAMYKIVRDTVDLSGRVFAEDWCELYSYEDWLSFKDHVKWGLRGYLLEGLAVLCWHLMGRVRPLYHGRWISSRFRAFWQKLEVGR